MVTLEVGANMPHVIRNSSDSSMRNTLMASIDWSIQLHKEDQKVVDFLMILRARRRTSLYPVEENWAESIAPVRESQS
jgi:hypothetical protein